MSLEIEASNRLAPVPVRAPLWLCAMTTRLRAPEIGVEVFEHPFAEGWTFTVHHGPCCGLYETPADAVQAAQQVAPL